MFSCLLFLLQLSLASSWISFGDMEMENIPIEMPNMTEFPFSAQLKSNQYSFHWTIDDRDTLDETLRGVLVLKSSADNTSMDYVKGSWIGIGFGKQMVNSEIHVCHLKENPSEGLIFHMHKTADKYEVPVMQQD
jgi:hypothetical protein